MTTLATPETINTLDQGVCPCGDGHSRHVSTYVCPDGSVQRNALVFRLWPCRGVYSQKAALLANETDSASSNPVV